MNDEMVRKKEKIVLVSFNISPKKNTKYPFQDCRSPNRNPNSELAEDEVSVLATKLLPLPQLLLLLLQTTERRGEVIIRKARGPNIGPKSG